MVDLFVVMVRTILLRAPNNNIIKILHQIRDIVIKKLQNKVLILELFSKKLVFIHDLSA